MDNKDGWAKRDRDRYVRKKRIYLQVHEKIEERESERIQKAAEERAKQIVAEKEARQRANPEICKSTPPPTTLASKASLRANDLAPPARIVADPKIHGGPAPPPLVPKVIPRPKMPPYKDGEHFIAECPSIRQSFKSGGALEAVQILRAKLANQSEYLYMIPGTLKKKNC